MRIVSLLPSATEMVCALGLQEELVGITHCCDFPLDILNRPKVVQSNIPVERLSFREIDASVRHALKNGESLYRINARLLADLKPDLILTQDLCEVCAPAGKEVTRALNELSHTPEVIWMSPHTLGDIENDILSLGTVTKRAKSARTFIQSGRKRIERISHLTGSNQSKPSVFCAEWIDPLFCAGHWVPEMVEIAGGTDVLGRKGENSARINFLDLRNANPDFIVLMPCGYACANHSEQIQWLMEQPGWDSLRAVEKNQVFSVDGAYFNRPSPRVIEGIELLASILNPSVCIWNGDPSSWHHYHF